MVLGKILALRLKRLAKCAVYVTMVAIMAIDKLDRDLIRLLTVDASQSSYELSKKLKTSPSTIRRRVRALTREGAISIRAAVDYSKIGLSLAAHLALNVDPEEMENVWEALRQMPEIRHVSITAGRYDVMGLARVNSTGELLEFVQNKVTQLKGVRHCETFICLRMEKIS